MPSTLRHPGLTAPGLTLLRSEYFVLGLAALYYAALAPFTPGFTTSGNLQNVLATLLPLFIVAVGQTVVLVTGGIDLSVTSIIALCSISGAAVMNGDNGWLAEDALGVPAGILLMLLVGGSVGLAIRLGQLDRFGARISFSAIPRRLTEEARSPFQGIGGANLTLPAGLGPGKPTMPNPNADMSTALSNLLEAVIETSLVSSGTGRRDSLRFPEGVRYCAEIATMCVVLFRSLWRASFVPLRLRDELPAIIQLMPSILFEKR